MDVVIVTLLRSSLSYTLKSVYETIPEANVILITDKNKGRTGELRNKGLRQCTSEFTCFVDDDIILNPAWYSKCMECLQSDPSLIAVVGSARVGGTVEGCTYGCMICKTREMKEAGGFPRLETFLPDKLGSKMVMLQDAVCDHLIPRGLGAIHHTLYFLTSCFQTENKVGIYHNPIVSVKQIFSFLKEGSPDYVFCELLWIIKTLFSLPFLVKR